MSRSKVKAGHTRYYWHDMFGVMTMQIVKRRGNRFLVRIQDWTDLLYGEMSILRNTYPTYRKALRSVV